MSSIEKGETDIGNNDKNSTTTSPVVGPKHDDSHAPENVDIQDTSTVGKVRALLGMLTKFMGVKDIVNL